jgi:hypothetical protein
VSGGTTALVVAIVGVFGTLFAPIVSQRLTAQARRDDFERERTQRNDEYAREQQQARASSKRNCYLSLSQSAGRYHSELMNYLYKINLKTHDEDARTTLDEARFRFNASQHEIRLTGTLKVVERSDTFSEEIAGLFAATMRLAQGNPEPDDSFEKLRARIFTMWRQVWPPLLIAMREDLGVED